MKSLTRGLGILLLVSIGSTGARAQDADSAQSSLSDKPRYILSDHKDVIWCAVFSPDGKSLYTCSGNRDAKAGELRGYDLTKGKPVQTFLAQEPHGIRWIAFAPSGLVLATAEYDGTVKMRDPATGKVLKQFVAHPGGVQCLKFTRDGRTLVTCGKDFKANVWDVATTKVKRTISGHSNHVYSLDLSRDDRTLLTGCRDATAVLWDVATGQIKGNVPGNKASIEVVRYSPDGTIFAVAGWDWVVNIWDVATSRKLTVLYSPKGGILAMGFSPDGKYFLAGTETGSLQMWDVSTWRAIATIQRIRRTSAPSRFPPTASCAPRPATTGQSRSGTCPRPRPQPSPAIDQRSEAFAQFDHEFADVLQPKKKASRTLNSRASSPATEMTDERRRLPVAALNERSRRRRSHRAAPRSAFARAGNDVDRRCRDRAGPATARKGQSPPGVRPKWDLLARPGDRPLRHDLRVHDGRRHPPRCRSPASTPALGTVGGMPLRRRHHRVALPADGCGVLGPGLGRVQAVQSFPQDPPRAQPGLICPRGVLLLLAHRVPRDAPRMLLERANPEMVGMPRLVGRVAGNVGPRRVGDPSPPDHGRVLQDLLSIARNPAGVNSKRVNGENPSAPQNTEAAASPARPR